MKVPSVDLVGCDVFLWKEGDTVYHLDVNTNIVLRVAEGALADFIRSFPQDRTLCIMNDQTGQPVRISPLAN